MKANHEVELELTYLAKFLPPEIKGVEPEQMVDVYVPQDPKIVHPNLRIRKRGDRYEITKKAPIKDGDSSRQSEQTVPLTADEFTNLSQASSRQVAKDRYKVRLAESLAEVDVFKNKLAGLVLIDFEFETDADKSAFVPPDCCLADVTQEDFIAGGLLAGKSFKDIQDQLAGFGYVAINA